MQDESPTNSVLEVKLDYIQKDINVIKSDVKDIKNDYISRREFGVSNKDLEEKLSERISVVNDKANQHSKVIWGVVTALLLMIASAIGKLIFK